MLESKFKNAREKTIFLSLEATSIVVFFLLVLYFTSETFLSL